MCFIITGPALKVKHRWKVFNNWTPGCFASLYYFAQWKGGEWKKAEKGGHKHIAWNGSEIAEGGIYTYPTLALARDHCAFGRVIVKVAVKGPRYRNKHGIATYSEAKIVALYDKAGKRMIQRWR